MLVFRKSKIRWSHAAKHDCIAQLMNKKVLKTRPVSLGPYSVGSSQFVVIAGPCSVEGAEQFKLAASSVCKAGASVLRGGIYKLRTSPKSFQGLGKEGLSIAKEVSKSLKMPLVSEVVDPRHIDELYDVVDAFQVGTRNMYNYALLKELGKVDKPVVLKRAFSAMVDEWLLAADYIVTHGNENVILCERGIRTFERVTRNTLDLGSVAYLKAQASFPVIVDPSHGTGVASLVPPMILASAAAGADGVLVEVHPDPKAALSDGHQALDIATFEESLKTLEKVLHAMGRELQKPRA